MTIVPARVYDDTTRICDIKDGGCNNNDNNIIINDNNNMLLLF